MERLRTGLLMLSLLVVMVCLACGGAGDSPRTEPEVGQVRGLVVEVTSGSLTELASLVVRDDKGRLWEFRAGGFVGFTPSHLREHQAFGLPVTVRYRDAPDGPVVVSISD
jgi:hypothetical protein